MLGISSLTLFLCMEDTKANGNIYFVRAKRVFTLFGLTRSVFIESFYFLMFFGVARTGLQDEPICFL